MYLSILHFLVGFNIKPLATPLVLLDKFIQLLYDEINHKNYMIVHILLCIFNDVVHGTPFKDCLAVGLQLNYVHRDFLSSLEQY